MEPDQWFAILVSFDSTLTYTLDVHLSFRAFDIFVKTNANKVSKSKDIEFDFPQATRLQNIAKENPNLGIRTELLFFCFEIRLSLKLTAAPKGILGPWN